MEGRGIIMDLDAKPSCNKYSWKCWLFHFSLRAAAGTVAVILVRLMVLHGVL